MDRLNILVLHRLGNPKLAPNFLYHHVFSLKNNFPDHNYIYHDTALSLPDYVHDTVFDAIILDVTFLCVRWSPVAVFTNIKNEYGFVKYSDAVKIAFPQDEYDCNELLDDWMCDWGVDVVFSVISSHWDVLYPQYHKVGCIKLGYTGYIDETLISMEGKTFANRAIDIGYRARKLPPYFGRIGETKWTIGRDVELQSKKAGLTTNIVLGEQGTLLGGAWLDFINNCKFTLGTNSGSSLLDPRGDIQQRVRAYLEKYPAASFEEIEERFFKGLDGRYSFTAISPRVLEAALLLSCQILVEGEYSGIIQPWEHYIPIRHDASNFTEVFHAMRDQGLVERLIKNCKEVILATEELRYKHKACKIIEFIADHATKKRVASSCDAVRKIAGQYERDMTEKYAEYWRRQAFRRQLVRFLDRSPVVSRLVRSVRSMVRR